MPDDRKIQPEAQTEGQRGRSRSLKSPVSRLQKRDPIWLLAMSREADYRRKTRSQRATGISNMPGASTLLNRSCQKADIFLGNRPRKWSNDMKLKYFYLTLTLLALGLAGCKSPNQYSSAEGAPSSGYDEEMGQGRSPIIQSNQVPNYPQGPYYLWKYKGITPTTP